jgi:hypothetical protein
MTDESPAVASISTRILIRLIVLLIAVWSLLAGLVLVAFHGAGSGAMGAGVADDAGQRLVGTHLLLLTPMYLLIAWRFQRYEGLLWLPFFGQVILALTVAYNIISGDTHFGDGILAVAISSILAGLLGFVWMTEQREIARAKIEAAHRDIEAAWRDDSDNP